MKGQHVPLLFIVGALLALLAGLFFGVLGSLQYIIPGLFKEHFAFHKIRPLHVTLVITWIYTAATGGIYYYLPRVSQKRLYSDLLAKIHFFLLVGTGFTILTCYFTGNFGGREYLEFPPLLAIPMMLSWIFFMINFVFTVRKNIRTWPVYIWMWATGLLFFMITFIESYLWTFSYFNTNTVRDITIQWKANGSMVGSWNMLVYGTGFYVMEQVSGKINTANSRLTFFFYFLGLTNLMFNWGHHTYIVPAAPWIKNTAYIISMTELLILGNIILNWKKSLSDSAKNFHLIPYRFLAAADFWIFLNLTLAIIISIPAINYYTHGTHITVAHAMGATIGINTMILFASIFYIAEKNLFPLNRTTLRNGFWITNISLLVFWHSLLGSGLVKMAEKENGSPFQFIMQKLSPWFHAFSVAGLGILAGILLISIPLLKHLINNIFLTTKVLIKQ